MALTNDILVVQDMVALIAEHAGDEEGRRETSFGIRARKPIGAFLVDFCRHLLCPPRVQRAPAALHKELKRLVARPTVGNSERTLGKRLWFAGVERHRCDAVRPGEAHVGEVVALLHAHLKGEVRECRVWLVSIIRLVPAHTAE
eukprot:CAMPEP_0115859414 /NCGR_PEP_ID=MMETSP0287-20121206/16603_1 /TAXON_ID=412157 /ORGANISM="Chrysochromulina rotalis, Strain UIO044" /LENGTH=143 /DNA_ID=CAMNT_0003313713 /DNA_START=280 /DNA_END=711 /DNA_ORIENTATION=+